MTIDKNRRETLAGAAAAVALAAAPSARARPANKPNVVFILADDLGYADLSCYGQTAFETPVLDRLAKAGMKLSQGYSSSSVCSPTRVALLTGRYQYRLPIGLYEPVPTARADAVSVPESHPTIASLFRAQGYRTSLSGKWHLGGLPEHGPGKSGYDRYFCFVGGASDYFTHSGPNKSGPGLWENDRQVDKPGYLTDHITDWATAEIEAAAKAGQPFFMSLHYNAPHWPWEGPGDEAVANGLKELRHPDGGSLKKYAEMVGYLDMSVGKVLAALKRTGVERDTIVVFTSDNGGERFSQMWPFVGMKGELLEGGVRVPAIVRWPAGVRAGSTSDQVLVSHDWLPTLLAAAGGRPDPAYPSDGENLLPVLTGQAQARPRKLFWRFKASEQAAVRDGDWKYLKLGGKTFLFDLSADQHERANLKTKEPAIYQRLAADYEAWNKAMLPYLAEHSSENLKAQPDISDRY